MTFWWLQKRLHVSWMIAVMAAGFVVGVIAAQYFSQLHSPVWLLMGVSLAALGFW